MSNVERTETQSTFTGGAFANYFINVASKFVSTISLGLLSPAMICWKERWLAKHTYINGRRLVFDGTGSQLFGKYILWLLLSVITLGIYLIWMPIRKEQWVAKHMHFEDGSDTERESYFDGSALGLFGVRLLTVFVTLITLTFGIYWAICFTERWYKKHTVIDGERLEFNGKGIQLFGKLIIWYLLTVITIGFYSFWLVVKYKKWIVYHTHVFLSTTDEESLHTYQIQITECMNIPDEVTVIDGYTFRNCKILKKITIGSNVVRIANGAFAGCTNLERVTFMDSSDWKAISPTDDKEQWKITGQSLTKVPTAVRYLTKTFANYIWVKDTME